MKTAIQELIEKLNEEINFITDEDSFGDKRHRAGLREAKSIDEELLEKEKQQIIDFANKCRMVNNIDADGNVSFIFTPELQFEKTFKKLHCSLKK